ncbi:rare lipoprotein A [Gracilibacillus alcaliphilus]|nr:rare lipoprotein A [Gracilibacillus alcaliphilus]
MMYYNPYHYTGNPDYTYDIRQNLINGQATWTEGGATTQCNLPWSHNQYMTAAVSSQSPYQCGQLIKVIYPQNGREVIVTVVDAVPNAPATRINLHRKAFEALGVNPAVGVIPIQFEPSPHLEEEKWGKYLLEVTQVAYPHLRVTDYALVERSQPAANQVKEVYDFVLQGAQEQLTIRGTVIYNPTTDRVVSFNIQEI